MTDAGLEITPDALDGGAVTHYFIDGITGGWLYKNDGTMLITKDNTHHGSRRRRRPEVHAARQPQYGSR